LSVAEGIGARSLLDEIMPVYDVGSRHAIAVAARPADVYQAARHADLGRPTLVRILMGIRTLPALAARLAGGSACSRAAADRYTVGGASFTLVAEAPGEEFVLGIMGRFWRPTGSLIRATPEQLRQPPPPGTVQALWNFRVEPSGAGTMLSTETRVRCADEATRRRFLLYWRIVKPGSGLIRRSILGHMRALAELRSRNDG
jgi:hypothetical protein